MTTATKRSDPARSATASDGEYELSVIVRDVRPLADGVVGLTLAPETGVDLPGWAPGAHIDVLLDADTVRQYSLCGTDGAGVWEIAVLREPQSAGGSIRVHGLRPGDELAVRGPRNHFELEPADEYVFVAGGIGITPILPMLHAAQRAGASWHLYYGGRSRTTMAFRGELQEFGDRVTIHPEDEVGRLDIPAITAAHSAEALLYCCGPAGLLSAITDATADRPEGSVRMERFSPSEPLVRDDDSAFEVECRMSGVAVTVAPDESILDALEREGGVVIGSSCREGTCGTCETTVIEGVPDHRDSILSEAERQAGDVMMPCVSRACGGRLVLDI